MALDAEGILNQLPLVRVHEQDGGAGTLASVLAIRLRFKSSLHWRRSLELIDSFLDVLNAFWFLLHRLEVLPLLQLVTLIDS